MRMFQTLAIGIVAAPTFGQPWLELLGRLPGGANSADVKGVSADAGVIVGSSGSDLSYWGESTRWRYETGIEGLGPIAGVAQTHALGVSPGGDWIVGEVIHSNGSHEAYLWHEQGGGVLLGDPGHDQYGSWAHDVSNGARVVVGQSSGAQGRRAFRWTPQGGMESLGTLGAGPSAAYAVSADGSTIVGHAGLNGPSGEAFVWTADDGMIGLGDIGGGRHVSLAYNVSDNGNWIVGEGSAEYADGTRASEAVLWDRDGNLTRLGQRSGSGNRYSRAWDVSDDGRVAVGVAFGFEDFQRGWGQAMIWTPEWGMRNLEEVLLAEYGMDLGAMGIRLDSALGVTPDGRYIIGNAYIDTGQERHAEGFLLHLPIPAPATLVPLGGLALSAGRRRR